MSFLESQAKAGYYPTPPDLLPSTAALVTPATSRASRGSEGHLLDPCCGKGEAAAFLAKAWGLQGYGIEINHARAVEASILLEQVIEDDYAAVTASHNFSVLFLNPPYDYSETAGRRLEYEFLRDTTKYLVPGGILVYLIPGYRVLKHERIAVYLSTHYQDLRAYRFPAEHYGDFRQVVIFGHKKAECWRDDEAATKLVNDLVNDAARTPTLPTPDRVQPGERYTLPKAPTGRLVFHSTQLDWEAAAGEALTGGVWASREWQDLNLAVEPTLAEETLVHGGFHARVDAFAQAPGGLVLLSLIGRETHVKALWAALMTNQVLQFRPGLNFAKGGAKMYRTLKARLPCSGAAHWVIVHKRATVEGTEPITKQSVQETVAEEEETAVGIFYTFSPANGTNFLAQLGKAMLLPTLPGWEQHLAHEGRRRGKLARLSARHTHGCQVWRVLPSTLTWRNIISYGIEDGLLDTSPETVERAQSESTLIPAMPLKRGHIARLLEAGLLDNVVIERAGKRLILRGRTVQIEEKVPTTKKNVEITRTRYLTEILAVDLDSGEMEHINDDAALAAFIEEWQEELAQAVVAQFEPRYRFDYPDRLSDLQLQLLDDVLAKRCHLPGRTATGLLEGQKHVAAAAHEVLKASPFAIVVGEMGVGKTKIGIAVAGLRELDRGAFPVLTVCPPHLAEKWAREWRQTWPKCLSVILKSPRNVDDFARMARHPNGYHYVGIITSTMVSLGSGWEPAYNRSSRNPHLLTCPDCGQVIRDEEEAPAGVDYLAKKQRSCLSCDAPLWQFTNQARQARPEPALSTVEGPGRRGEEQPGFAYLGQVQHLVQAGKWNFFHHSTPVPARWPLADYIVRQHPRLFKMFIVDESHQYKGESADRAYAFGNLANTIPATLLLTGTLFGGAAPSLFYLLYRIDGRIRRMFAYDDVQGFTERYGVLEREVRYYDEVSDDGHSMAGNRRRRTTVRPRPGISPEMVTLLLDTTIFVRVADLGFELPPLEEIPVTLEMDELHKARYDAFYSEAIEALREAKECKVDLAGSFLQNLMGYCTAPFRVHQVTSTDEHGQTTVWAEAPDLEISCSHCGRFLDLNQFYCPDCHPEMYEESEGPEGEGKAEPAEPHPGGCGTKRLHVFPKERWLIDLCQAERAQGRKVIVFCRQTASRDITERLAGLLQAEGLRTLRLGSVSAEKREAWLNQQVRRGIDVFLVNPRSVETGLDLVAFSTGVFYEVDYSLYTVWQAARRLWRLGQTQPVKIYYPVQKGTLMEKAAGLVKQKMAAALMLYGDNVERVMGQANEGTLLQELTKAAIEGAEVEDLATIFARHNTEQIGGSGYLLADGEQPDLADTIVECLTSPVEQLSPERQRPVLVQSARQLAFAM